MAEPTRDRILIADDNEANVELLEAYLSDSDLNVEIAVAVDGQDTLDKAASFQPDLILLDVMMPKLSGFEVCQKLKGNPATSNAMILMFSDRVELGYAELAVEAGADDFITMPADSALFMKRLQILLEFAAI
jgi:CheY-like chemotaxis protein